MAGGPRRTAGGGDGSRGGACGRGGREFLSVSGGRPGFTAFFWRFTSVGAFSSGFLGATVEPLGFLSAVGTSGVPPLSMPPGISQRSVSRQVYKTTPRNSALVG
eukprot:1379472-Amorphochlora_amoeboformis.AAC.1